MPRNIRALLMGSTSILRAPEDDSGQAPTIVTPPVEGEVTPSVTPPAEIVTPPVEQTEGNRPSDGEAKLLKEVMKHKEAAKVAEARAKAYEGIDPEKARAALAAQSEAERKELEARGEYTRILDQVREQSATEIAAANQAVADLQEQLNAIQATAQTQAVANLFATSAFVRDSLVISGTKVQALYGDHFENVDGELVGYDKPRGAKDRTPLVGSDAKPLNFEAALEKVVKADAEWERLAKSKLKPGAGSGTTSINPKQTERPETGQDKIRAGLASLSKPSLNLAGVTRR
jgi:hypothetical protein